MTIINDIFTERVKIHMYIFESFISGKRYIKVITIISYIN